MFLTDLFKGIAGQQDTPEFNLQTPGELLSGVGRSAGQVADINRAYALPAANLQRDVENVYDPNQGRLREATTSSILKELGLGGEIPADVQQQVIQNALQGNAAAGFGASNAGRGVVGRDLGLTGLDLLNQRIGRAASYTRSAPMITPSGGITSSDIANQILGNQNSQNSFNTFASNIKSQNRVNMIQKPLDMAAGVAGSFFGLGGLMGGAGGFGSILKTAGSSGAPGYGNATNIPASAG